MYIPSPPERKFALPDPIRTHQGKDGAGRLKARAGSFCMERSGYNEGGLNDQGISFFLPNMTWFVHTPARVVLNSDYV